MQFTVQRFFSQLSSRLCCQARLEKLNELKHEECYEKELSDAALAAASGAAPSENAGDDKRLTQFDEKQLSDMIGELRSRISRAAAAPCSYLRNIRQFLRH